MNINSTNINFKSRSPVVKKADKICRFVKTEFPSVSSSIIPKRCNKTLIDKVKRFGERTPQIENGDLWDIRYNKFRTLFFRVNEKLRTLVRKPFNDTIGVVEENKVLTKLIKNHHLANCAELTRLANLICTVNGIKS